VLDSADDSATEEACKLLDSALAEFLLTLRDAVPASTAKGALASKEIVAALGALTTHHTCAVSHSVGGQPSRRSSLLTLGRKRREIFGAEESIGYGARILSLFLAIIEVGLVRVYKLEGV
jgi:hypothetical protein